MITAIKDKALTVFEITGTDVQTFLNNQVVSELKNFPDSPQLTAICSPKGRIVFTLLLAMQPERSYVAVDASLCDNFLQYINMRRFRMDVKIKKSTKMLALNCAAGHSNMYDEMLFTDDANLQLADTDDFWLFMFKTGLPWVTSETSECFIPQHVNLDQLNVIDFNKGCYPGQEIVARLHFLGKVKKRMQYVQYQSNQPHTPASQIQIPEYDKPIEFCAPSILVHEKWHSQAIVTT